MVKSTVPMSNAPIVGGKNTKSVFLQVKPWSKVYEIVVDQYALEKS